MITFPIDLILIFPLILFLIVIFVYFLLFYDIIFEKSKPKDYQSNKKNNEVKVNICHDKVKVKLTQLGVKILKEKYDKLNSSCDGFKFEWMESLDKEGYYVIDMADLMKTFGTYIKVGCFLPFDSNIIILKDEVN